MKKYWICICVLMIGVALMAESAPTYIIVGNVVLRHAAFMWADGDVAKWNLGLRAQEDSVVLLDTQHTILTAAPAIRTGYCAVITVFNAEANKLLQKRGENLVLQPLSSGGALVAIDNGVSMPQIMWTELVTPMRSAKKCTFIIALGDLRDSKKMLERRIRLMFTGTVQTN